MTPAYIHTQSRLLAGMYEEKNEVYSIHSHVPEFRYRHSYLCFITFCSTHSTLVIFMKILPLVYLESKIVSHATVPNKAIKKDSCKYFTDIQPVVIQKLIHIATAL